MAGQNMVLIDFQGVYGGRRSREELLRVVKEAMALVENVAPERQILCSGFRVEAQRPLVDFQGIYGGPRSRDEMLRVLKETLALVENVAPGSDLLCSGFRLEVTAPRRGD